MVVTHPASDGRTVADVVGGWRIAFTQPRKGQFTDAFGYPHANFGTPFKGARTVHCAGPVRSGPETPLLRGTRCDRAHGASGGRHFAGCDPATGSDPATGTGTLTGVTTAGKDLPGGESAYAYATWPGTGAERLYRRAQAD
ncbi:MULTISPECIES: hypothetical protein [Streptomyces]|uniref:hypothetical protein n=1 Tax=Streptomyces TaxID=1883 RepID=UPI000B9E756D|nr:hypothetical protein [Streptomyces kasugaensis]